MQLSTGKHPARPGATAASSKLAFLEPNRTAPFGHMHARLGGQQSMQSWQQAAAPLHAIAFGAHACPLGGAGATQPDGPVHQATGPPPCSCCRPMSHFRTPPDGGSWVAAGMLPTRPMLHTLKRMTALPRPYPLHTIHTMCTTHIHKPNRCTPTALPIKCSFPYPGLRQHPHLVIHLPLPLS